MFRQILIHVFTGALVSSPAVDASPPKVEDLPLLAGGKIARTIPTDTTRTNQFGDDDYFIRCGMSIDHLDGRNLSVVTPDILGSVDSTETATCVSPLAFSPNGKRIAMEAHQGGDRIYILDGGESIPVWVTRGLLTRVEGTTTSFYNHGSISWSPDSERLATFSTLGSLDSGTESIISVFEGDSLRTLYSFHQDEHWASDLPMCWSPDSDALFAAIPQSRQLIKFSMDIEKPETVLVAEDWIGSITWDPLYKLMAFNVGSSLWVYDGQTRRKIFTAPWVIDFISWCKDGTRMAIGGINGELVIIDEDGGEPWNVTGAIENTWMIYNVVWLDARRFSYILVTKSPEEDTKLYLGNASTKTVRRISTGKIACTRVESIGDGILYFKILDSGPWLEHERRSHWDLGGRSRKIELGLFFWDSAASRSLRVSPQVFHTFESEGNFAVYDYSVLWVPSQ